MTLPEKKTKAGLPARRLVKPNALKHGAFSAIELLPWEDSDAFEQLRQELFDEHKPEGPSQDDCVETILSCMWRKLRFRAKRKFETAAALKKTQNRVFEEVPPPLFDTDLERIKYSLSNILRERSESASVGKSAPVRSEWVIDDYGHLCRLSNSFFGEQSSKSVNLSLMLSPTKLRDHLEQHVPEANFETTEQWIIALKREIDSVLLPMVKKRRPDPNGYWEVAAQYLASDRMIEDLAVEERLDAKYGPRVAPPLLVKGPEAVGARSCAKAYQRQSNSLSHSITLVEAEATFRRCFQKSTPKVVLTRA
jgi:hypothetical protein